ncbi:hypothetical protein ACIOMM_30725 [Streptomyces sp. NPDC087908]|uniref:hypothetical protein n=1 Tax=Streptomyces sp. NPDC087908 TaxID=3365820 RepID=UPI003802632C
MQASSHATVLTLVCLQCAEPFTVRNRTDLASLRIWNADTFPRSEQTSRTPCPTCREEAAHTRELRDRHEAEEQRRSAERTRQEKEADIAARVSAASNWLARHAEQPEPGELPEPAAALTLLTMLTIMITSDTASFGPLNKLSYQLGPTASSDGDTLAELHAQGWIAPTLPATTADFVFADKNTVEAVYTENVPWRLAHACGDTAEDRQTIAEHLRLLLLDEPDSLRKLAEDLNVATAITYLNSLLVTKYNEAPLPEHRLPDAHTYFRQALHQGFTFGQTLAVAWSAAASAVAWGQRTPGLKPGSVSSAAITNRERRLGFARDRKVPEYDLPHWATPPANYNTVARLLEQHEAESHALARFRALQQRIASRETEELELLGDLADIQEDAPPRRPSDGQITFGLITPDGDLRFRTGTTEEMADEVGMSASHELLSLPCEADSNMSIHLASPQPTTPASANVVASSVMHLLTGWLPPVNGVVAFTATAPAHGPTLQGDQQEMLQAAHAVAKLRNTPILTS